MIPTAEIHFSGAGLIDLGLQDAGVNVVRSFEMDPLCVATARRNFSHDIVQIDIRQKLALAYPDTDVLVASYPCNRYSEIGNIHGVRTGDELYLHTFRHLALKRPEVFVLENVPGMRMFPVVMEAMTKLPGYYVQVFCPVSSQLWLPQRRDRLILLGSRKSFEWRAPSTRKPAVRLKDILERDPQVEIPPYVAKRLRGAYRDQPIISDAAKGDIAPTCVAHYAKDLSTRLVVDRNFRFGVRPYTVREYARLQGVPDDFVFIGGRAAYRMIGNGVSFPVARWFGREIMRYFKLN